MAQAFEPIRFSVEKILPYALLVLVGSPKIWQVMAVVGLVPSHRDWQKIFGSLRKNEAEKLDIFRLHMATVSFRLKDGLLEKIQKPILKRISSSSIRWSILETASRTRTSTFVTITT